MPVACALTAVLLCVRRAAASTRAVVYLKVEAAALSTPFDVVKTRVQTDTALATAGIGAAAAAVLRDAPGRGVLRLAAFFNGLPPTAFGYLMQGCAKFGGYELLKQQGFGRMRAAGA